jgi:hypothetical protein
VHTFQLTAIEGILDGVAFVYTPAAWLYPDLGAGAVLGSEKTCSMLGGIALLIVSGAVGAFMITRVYLLIFRGELNVRGAVYSRASTPIQYWMTLVMALAGVVFTVGIAFIMAVGLTGGLPS